MNHTADLVEGNGEPKQTKQRETAGEDCWEMERGHTTRENAPRRTLWWVEFGRFPLSLASLGGFSSLHSRLLRLRHRYEQN
jgi:hypothetical protein